MDLSLPSRTFVRAAVALAVVAGLLFSAQYASAAASRSSTERAVRVKVVKLYRVFTIAKSVQVKCKKISSTRFGCYYLVPIPPKKKVKVYKTKIMLGNVFVRYRGRRAHITFSHPRCLGAGCTRKKG